VMTREQAELWGTVGPTARASGVPRDLRVDSPYAGYGEFPVRLITEAAGDLEARFVVRLRELQESYRLIHEILAHLPEGELTARMKRRIPEGEALIRVEAPRGELFYFVKSNGTDSPERVKARTPTICNMASVLQLTVGHQLADVPMILAGIDPCFSCNDRAVILRRGASADTWTWEDLRQHGIRVYHERA